MSIRTLERTTKGCKKHGIVAHVLVPQFWPKTGASRKTFFVACCVTCRRGYTAAYRARHPERVNTDAIRARDRERHARDKKKRNACRRASNCKNKVRLAAANKLWREANRVYVKTKNAVYHQSHKPEALLYKRAWKKRNPEKVKAGNRRYQSAHPEEYRQTQRASEYRRRMRKVGTCDGSVARLWRSTVRAYDSRCAYCGRHGRVEQDHVIPVSRGGAHVIRNVVPCCRGCNTKKGVRIWSPRPWAAMLPKEAA